MSKDAFSSCHSNEDRKVWLLKEDRKKSADKNHIPYPDMKVQNTVITLHIGTDRLG